MNPPTTVTPTELPAGESPEEQVRALYEKAETASAKVLEELVARPSFGR